MNRLSKKTPFWQSVHLITSFIVSFAALYLGILALGWDLLGFGLLIEHASFFARPVLYVIGVFGAISFILLLYDAWSYDR